DVDMSDIDTGDVLLVITAAHVAPGQQPLESAGVAAAIVEYADDAIIGVRLDGTITSWNPAAERMYGYSRAEIIGRSGRVLTPLDRAGESAAVLARVGAAHEVEHLETNRVRKDGTVVPVSITVAPIRNSDGVVVGASGIHRDVTEQRQAFETALRMAAIVKDSGDAIVSASLDGIMTSWNPAAERMYGYSSEEIIGRSAEVLVAEDGADVVRVVLERTAAGQHVEALEAKCLRKDAVVFPVTVTVSPIRDADGAVVGASLIARDLTGQIHAARYARSLIEAGLDPLVSISPEGLITDVNEATIKVTGVPREELIGTEFFEYFTEPEKAKRIYRQVFAEGMAVDYPLTMRHTDGTLTEVRYNASVYRDPEGKVLGVFAVARDVTRQMQAQREISEQQVKALDKLVELEAFQRLTVGRELKMIDLKKEIEFLRRHVAD
ncbi:MAG: hypothetical protein QOE58_1589, partial [Actinomycetota bacterium]|nr:hypothetical protein [Actinomycetota bacterium]